MTCEYRGRSLTGPEKLERGKGPVRDWRFCLHVEQPIGEVVCSCKGCKRGGCRGYVEAAAKVPADVARVHIGEPDEYVI